MSSANLSYPQNHLRLFQEVPQTWWVLATHYNPPSLWLPRLCGSIQFCQTELIRKILEATGMEDCNWLPTPTKVESPLGADVYGSEAKIDWPNSYASIIGMMLYLASNTRPDISFAVHQYAGLLLTPRYHTRQL